jgi:threonine synthase
LLDQIWSPNKTIETAAKAMDVSNPSNWPRIMAMFNNDVEQLKLMVSATLKTDEETFAAMKKLQSIGYIAEPHTAIAYAGLVESLRDGEQGVFISTAHPAKFIESVEQQLNIEIDLPLALAKVQNLQNLSISVTNDTDKFNQSLLT